MIAVTGANGHLGQRLLQVLAGGGPVRALVRSERAAQQVTELGLGAGVQVCIVDYAAPDELAVALRGCRAVVHLVGIIKETVRNRYHDAHEAACAALASGAAQAGVRRIVYLSILGASPESRNPCLASKGAAERLLAKGTVPATVIRVPMVLGEADYATAALAARAVRGWNVLLRGDSYEQPIYAGDVADAVLAVLNAPSPQPDYDLAGPESLTRTSLTHRAAQVLGRRTRVLSLPLGVGLALAFVLEKLTSEPPVTRAMLGVLDHDDRIDTQPAVADLGIRLTSLDATLRRCFGQDTRP